MKHVLIIISFFLLCCNSEKLSPVNGSGDYVVLLHGIGKTSSSMNALEKFLAKQNYRVINAEYPSTSYTIEKISRQYLHAIIKQQCPDHSKKIHFVTHSMGGVLLRYYMQSHELDNIGRVVMLSPPNKGSELADIYGAFWPVRWILGPALDELGTGEDSIHMKLGALNFDAGIIAGRSTLDPLGSLLIPGEDDGRVSVDRTRVENMKDFLVVESSHSFITDSPVVLKQTAYFLQNGRFNHQ